MVITLSSKCGEDQQILVLQTEDDKTAKGKYLQFSWANKNFEIMNGQCNKKDNMELFAKEHKVQFCLLKQKWWIKHYTAYCV